MRVSQPETNAKNVIFVIPAESHLHNNERHLSGDAFYVIDECDGSYFILFRRLKKPIVPDTINSRKTTVGSFLPAVTDSQVANARRSKLAR